MVEIDFCTSAPRLASPLPASSSTVGWATVASASEPGCECDAPHAEQLETKSEEKYSALSSRSRMPRPSETAMSSMSASTSGIASASEFCVRRTWPPKKNLSHTKSRSESRSKSAAALVASPEPQPRATTFITLWRRMT